MHSQAFIDYAIARRVERPSRMTELGCPRLSEQQELMTVLLNALVFTKTGSFSSGRDPEITARAAC